MTIGHGALDPFISASERWFSTSVLFVQSEQACISSIPIAAQRAVRARSRRPQPPPVLPRCPQPPVPYPVTAPAPQMKYAIYMYT